MKTLLASAILISMATLPAAAHPGHSGHAYGIFWKSGAYAKANARQALPEDIWRYAFVSKYRW